MTFRSLTARLIATVLLIEAVLAFCVTLAALYYQHRETLGAFDIMLRGRADSVLGSVQDAEDPADNILLDKTSLDLPSHDVYEVREENGRFLGASPSSTALAKLPDDGAAHNLILNDRHYRAIVLHGLRTIDLTESPTVLGTAAAGSGVPHRFVVRYASPLRPVREAFRRAVRFFLLADGMALLLSIAAVALLIRRSLRPLGALAEQAAALTPKSWSFQAPASAYRMSELAPLATALDTALQGLEQAFRQQRNFVNDAAHELKTAVTVLKSSLQLLTFKDRSKDQYQSGIEGCLADCGRMEELVQRMLLLARLEQPETLSSSVPVRPCSLRAVILQVLTQLESAASLRRITITQSVEEDALICMAEEDCVTLVVNLMLNAIQHSSPGSTITVALKAQPPAGTAMIIRDQGEGIAAEHLPFLFERFYRADASRSRDTGGTGLGLAICKAIVDANGGSIQIASTPGQGTTATVILPVIDAFAGSEAGVQAKISSHG